MVHFNAEVQPEFRILQELVEAKKTMNNHKKTPAMKIF